jgi:isoleucyl-tRNA synthetase
MYRAVPAMLDLPAMEREILGFWAANDTFAASLERTKGGRPWTFYEGPPTANGMPGTHHIEARVFKDVFPRFKTMQGYHVDRKAGWDCHGLPVELAVEKELGFNGKPDIEAFGVEAFNAKCRESVSRHVDAFTELTERMGYWVNLDEAYWTMDPAFVESVWWALKQIHSAGLLVEDYRVAPYCPRCGTTLSDHELAQGYEDVTDPSVYVRFPLISGPLAGKASLLVWTTTPWTLVSNTAVAVHPDVTYVVATPSSGSGSDSEALVIAEPLAEKVLGEGWRLGETFTGRDLELWRYSRPFELVEFPEVIGGTHYVVLADYVTTEDGTGLVHQAPAFGEDDMGVCRQYGLPMVNPIRPDGTFDDALDLVGGLFFKTADAVLVDDLTARGLMFRVLAYEHSYPHCWRCHTTLLYYAQPSWYIRTTAIKDALLRENANTNWYPEHIKWGRYGDWLNNNIDWALSRSRYWGTPLPIWRCPAGHQTCVGSRAELSQLTGRDYSTLDPHRPFVDDVVFACPNCQQTAHRVPEVIDAWFDSGSMPFAQWGYPWADGSKESFAPAYPADFICEAIDQTRGWFYSLMAVGTLVFDKSSYKNVLCLGHILAEDGRKMSKHLGNILEPIPLMDTHGADAVRWFMAAGGSPWSSRRVGHGTIQETVRKVLMTYLNTVAFQSLYARANGWSPVNRGDGSQLGSANRGDGSQLGSDRTELRTVPAVQHVLDRWLTSARNTLVKQVTEALEDFDTQRAGALLASFVDDLSNWYVRRSRRRFWDGQPGALQTLHDTIDVVTRLMAPLVPFLTERVWQDLVVTTNPDGPASVHLAEWPAVDEAAIDPRLDEAMQLTRRIVELGRSARAEAKVKTRQPLSRALIPSAAFGLLDAELRAEVMAELNVERVESFASAGDLVDHSAKGNFRALGKRFGKQTPLVAGAIASADASVLAADLATHGRANVLVTELGEVEVTPDEVIVSERPREGWSVVNEQGETVALDLELTPELVAAGLAREVIRGVQEARKASGFEVSDRIRLEWTATDPATADAVRVHSALIGEEVLAVEVTEATTSQGTPTPSGIPANAGISDPTDWFGDDELGLRFRVTRVGQA